MSTQHELQLKPLDNGNVDWIVGLFHYRENNSIRFDVDVRDDRGSLPGLVDDDDVRYSQAFLQPDRTMAAWAGFSQVTFNSANATRYTLGARYTEDMKRDRHGINIVCPDPNATIGGGGLNLAGVDTRDIPYSPDPDSPTPVPGTCRITTHNDAEKTWAKTRTWRASSRLPRRAARVCADQHRFKSGVLQDGGTHADPEEVVTTNSG